MDGRVVGMYCTKEMHKWQGATYLNGKYEEHREKLDSRFKGKQMSTKPLKLGNMATAGVLFSFPPAPKVVDPYDVGNSYLKTHPLDTRKLGFGTRDAPKKGEFMSQQRAAQYKHTIDKSEGLERTHLQKKGPIDDQVEGIKGKIQEIDATHPELSKERTLDGDYVRDVCKHSYDVGRTVEGTTPVFLKDSRDKFYSLKRCVHVNKPRHVQKLATTNDEYGTCVMGVLDRMRIRSVA